MKTIVQSFRIAVGLASLASTVLAVPLGTNITIPDNNNNGSNPTVASNWYSNREDNETETNPNTINAQVWDLEGMYLNGSVLTMVGGFDFKNGTNYASRTWRGGDIFIDIGANSAVYGQAANGGSGTTEYTNIQPLNTPNIFGYDYVLDIGTFSGPANSTANATFGFNIVQLSAASIVTRVADVAASNPWTYVSGGLIAGSGAGTYGVLGAADVAAYGLLGDGGNNTHYYMTVDLAAVPGIWGTNVFHYTIECGNDDLMGGAQVPEAVSTWLTLSGALAGLLAVRRKLGA